ncbi:glycosyltransferase [Brevundimonas sp.]|uniref:glycosyltransferase n=1 Tax=Brevundimonas sp. TaxID=1871086 RepID=UPI002FCC09FF
MPTIVHPFFTEFRTETRAMREALAATESGRFDRVVFLAYGEGDFVRQETLAPGVEVRRIALKTVKGPRIFQRAVQFLFWTRAVGRSSSDLSPALVHAHSLASLPASVSLANRARVPLVYDAHELETERNVWPWPVRMIAKRVEAALMPSVDAVLSVAGRIVDHYRQSYPSSTRRYLLVRNFPMRRWRPVDRPSPMRAALGIPEDDVVFLYLGAQGPNRGVETILEVFQSAPPGRHAVFMGRGPLEGLIREAAAKSPSIHLLPPVKGEDVLTWAAGADVGLALFQGDALSHYYALPNKVLEATSAGLPVITSDFPEMRDFLTEHGAGWFVQPTASSLEELLEGLSDDDIRSRRLKSVDSVPCWETESQQLIALYDELLARS